MILLIILAALFGLTFIVSASILPYTGLFFFISVRMLLASALLLGYRHWIGQKTPIKRADWPRFILLGVGLIFLPFAAECFALKYVPAAHVSLIWSLEPFATAFYSWLLFRQYLTRRQVIGWIIGFFGIISLLIQTHGNELALPQVWRFSLADLLLILCVVITAYAWINFKRLLQGYSSVHINGVIMLIGGCLSLGASMVFEAWAPVPIAPLSSWPSVLLAACALVVISNLAAYNLYGYLLKKHTATLLAFSCSVLIPLFTIFFEFVFLHQTIGWDFLARVAVVWVGLYLFYSHERPEVLTVNH